MNAKFYFEHRDAEFCYTEKYFQNEMESDGRTEMEVLEAVACTDADVFWCKQYGRLTEKGEGYCGKGCRGYEPRNKVSGCCKHYSTVMYGHGGPITLKLAK